MKTRVILFLILFSISQIFFASLIDAYRKGKIKFVSNPAFGNKTNWASLFYDTNKRMTVTHDGTIFVTNVLNHNIYKFSQTGIYIGKFGQKGEGTGDLFYPGEITILDGKIFLA